MQESSGNPPPTLLHEDTPPVNAARSKVFHYAVPSLFFLFFFLYVLKSIDPAILYSCNGFNISSYIRYLHEKERGAKTLHQPDRYSGDGYILELTPRFFREQLSVPGGLANLLVTFAVYSCNHSPLGATVLTVVALLLFLLVPLPSKKRYHDTLFLVKFIPSITMLVLIHFYDPVILAPVLPVIGGLAAAALYQKACDDSIFKKTTVLTILFWSTWYLFQWGVLLFWALSVIPPLFERPLRPVLPLVAVINLGALFLVENGMIAPENAMQPADLVRWPLPPLLLYLWFTVPALLRELPSAWRRALRKAVPRHAASHHRIIDGILVAAMTLLVVAWARNDRLLLDVRSTARTVHYLRNRMWDKVLAADFSAQFSHFPEKAGPLQCYLVHARNRSLAARGRLGDEMFSYPQATFSPEPLFLRKSTLEFGFPLWAAAADLFMDLGLVNYAEKVIGELMECMGPYPFLIYRRALLHLVKHNGETASVYLKKLRALPFYRKKTCDLLAVLGDSAAIATHPRIAHMRSCMDTTDYFFIAANEEELLLHLLDRNPRNKLAYEYLMACYLTTGNVDKLTDRLNEARAFGYLTPPRHWEEAICVYMARGDLDLSGATGMNMPMISPYTFHRFDRFMQDYLPLENDTAAAEKLGVEFGTTYYYFYTFEFSNGAKR